MKRGNPLDRAGTMGMLGDFRQQGRKFKSGKSFRSYHVGTLYITGRLKYQEIQNTAVFLGIFTIKVKRISDRCLSL
jgi:hypothetical protein